MVTSQSRMFCPRRRPIHAPRQFFLSRRLAEPILGSLRASKTRVTGKRASTLSIGAGVLPVLRQANPAELIHALRDTLVQRICNALGIGRLAEFVRIVGIGEERDFG